MDKKCEETPSEPKPQPLAVDKPDSEKIFRGLRDRFEPLAARLTHEDEPPFRFQP